jgi:hypothetical protein
MRAGVRVRSSTFSFLINLPVSIVFRAGGIFMSESQKPVLYDEGLDEYPVGTVIAANLVMLAWIAIGTVCCQEHAVVAAAGEQELKYLPLETRFI